MAEAEKARGPIAAQLAQEDELNPPTRYQLSSGRGATAVRSTGRVAGRAVLLDNINISVK